MFGGDFGLSPRAQVWAAHHGFCSKAVNSTFITELTSYALFIDLIIKVVFSLFCLGGRPHAPPLVECPNPDQVRALICTAAASPFSTSHPYAPVASAAAPCVSLSTSPTSCASLTFSAAASLTLSAAAGGGRSGCSSARTWLGLGLGLGLGFGFGLGLGG